MGGFCPLVELPCVGSAPAACAAGLLMKDEVVWREASGFATECIKKKDNMLLKNEQKKY